VAVAPDANKQAQAETPGTDTDKGDAKQGIAPLQKLCADDLQAVNTVIREHMQSPVALIPQLAGHIIAAGGKRLRPLLTLASARMCGYTGQRHIGLAASVEFIHTATLLHDDVVDESELRRGLDTANSVWGNQASVLVGDFLFSRAFQLMVADGSMRTLEILSNASAIISEGEVHQLITTNDTDTNEQAYLEVIEGKTAALFAAACQIGAVMAERSHEEEQALRRFGTGLGMAFQLVDDVLDYSAKQEALGKTVGDDFREGKITLPVVLAFERADAQEKAFWRRCLEDMDQREGDLPHAMRLLQRHDCLNDSLERARAYGRDARAAMDVFPNGEIKQALIQALDFSIERAY
jgi:octaprenyl-diphosphate synthase